MYRPLINLVDNMVTMGSLYGGDNLMLATQYRKVSQSVCVCVCVRERERV